MIEFFEDEKGEVIAGFVCEGIHIVEPLSYAEAFGVRCFNFVDIFPLEEDASIVKVELDVFVEVQVDLLHNRVDEIFETHCGYSTGSNLSEQIIIAPF